MRRGGAQIRRIDARKSGHHQKPRAHPVRAAGPGRPHGGAGTVDGDELHLVLHVPDSGLHGGLDVVHLEVEEDPLAPLAKLAHEREPGPDEELPADLVEGDEVAEPVDEPEGRVAAVEVEGDDQAIARVVGCIHAPLHSVCRPSRRQPPARAATAGCVPRMPADTDRKATLARARLPPDTGQARGAGSRSTRASPIATSMSPTTKFWVTVSPRIQAARAAPDTGVTKPRLIIVLGR